MAKHPLIRLSVLLPGGAIDESDPALNHERNRNTIRTSVIQEFLKEEPGTGVGALASGYRYDVETIKSGEVIYLIRPAQLNKGFDFVVHVQDAVFGNKKTNPRHKDIIEDLQDKLAFVDSLEDEVAQTYRDEILLMIRKIYYGIEPDLIVSNFETTEDLPDLPGMSLEMILKILKWLFIEQDICYWNWSGRTMLVKHIEEIFQT